MRTRERLVGGFLTLIASAGFLAILLELRELLLR